MLTVYLITIAIFTVVPFCWVLLKMAPWSAPLSACAGFFVGVIGTFAGSGRTMGFGFGLFAFCSLIFVLGGGTASR